MKLLLFAGIVALAANFARAQVAGTVKLDGEPPEMQEILIDGVPECAKLHTEPLKEDAVRVGKDGGLKNVVVSIEPQPGANFKDVKTKPAALDQKGCMYQPHVLAMMAGQTLIVTNSDPLAHNVHGQPQKNADFNFLQENRKQGDKSENKIQGLKTPEYFRIKCDVHPWMSAWVAVFDHPFFAVTDANGKYEIPKGLADGEYTVVAWHEKYDVRKSKVTIKDGKGAMNFTYKIESEPAPAK